MLAPIIVYTCLATGDDYTEACRAAMEAASKQSGVERIVNKYSDTLGKHVISYIEPSDVMVATFSSLAFLTKYSLGQNATVATRIHKDTSLSLTINREKAVLGLNFDF